MSVEMSCFLYIYLSEEGAGFKEGRVINLSSPLYFYQNVSMNEDLCVCLAERMR